ncbi:signal peptidase II [Novosphingobium sp.]|uniref:signal peptidase II n=1 Tax=Novosphingobium sp. TaxID=1874826 RepID=UPI0025EFCCBA|nr:signal peptidase II [Novosphingobium sp.]
MSASPLRNRLIGLALAALVLVLDLRTKAYVTDILGLDEDGKQIVLTAFFNLTRTSNFGVSMGLLTADSMEMRWLLVALTGAIALAVLVWLLRERRLVDIVPLGLVLGGAMGNIRDRALFGHVIDFADFHIGARHFYIFNLADAAISVGVLIILARSFLSSEKHPDQAAVAATEN